MSPSSVPSAMIPEGRWVGELLQVGALDDAELRREAHVRTPIPSPGFTSTHIAGPSPRTEHGSSPPDLREHRFRSAFASRPPLRERSTAGWADRTGAQVMEDGNRASTAVDFTEQTDGRLRSIADMALSSMRPESFRKQLFGYLDRIIGFDLAAATNTPDGARCEVHARGGLNAHDMRERMWRYLGELDLPELEAFFGDGPVLDCEILSASRMDRLSMYREVWRPCGVGMLMLAGWRNRFGAFALTLGRTGRPACFRRSELELMARCLPQIRLSEALMSGAEETSLEAWSRRVGLSRREQEVVALLARGLRNREIAGVLGLSPLTVRNQLAVAFRKAEVTTRAELVSAMHWREDTKPAMSSQKSSEGAPSPWRTFFRTHGADAK